MRSPCSRRVLRATVLALAAASSPLPGQPPSPTEASAHAGEAVRLVPDTGPRVTFKKCYREIAGSDQRPDQVRQAPAGATRWYSFPWGDGTAVIAAAGSTLWPDRDGDGDLREETPIRGSGQTTMMLALPSGPIETTLQIDVVGGGIRLTNLTRMSGTVGIGGKQVAVSLDDYLCNGRYDDYRTTKTAEYWLCDHVHFDLDGDGTFKNRIPPVGEDYTLARGFVFGNTVFSLEVLRRGEAIRFERSARKLAKVHVNVPAFSVALVSDEFGACHLNGKDGTAMLPDGRYRLDYCSYVRGSHTYRGLWWKEDGEPWIGIVDGMKFGLAGKLRYELYHEPNGKGGLNLWSICYGPHNERVMLWSDSRNSIEPKIWVESMAGDPLWSIVSHYC
jgi:hypothetical protein